MPVRPPMRLQRCYASAICQPQNNAYVHLSQHVTHGGNADESAGDEEHSNCCMMDEGGGSHMLTNADGGHKDCIFMPRPVR